MGEHIDPVTGNICGHAGGVPNLTLEQRALADTFAGTILASKIMAMLASHGQQWLSRFDAGAASGTGKLLDELAACGVLSVEKAKHGGVYWKHTPLTRPWCLTALALLREKPNSPNGTES